MSAQKTFAALLLSAALLFGQTPAQGARTHPPDPGTLDNNVYRNRTFNFSCKLPYGWVSRTKEMSAPADSAGKDSAAKTEALVLLAAFERPPEARGDSLNPAIVIAAEPADAYPGLKHAEDYYGPLKEVATAKGFAVTNQPYDFAIGEKHLVRVDFAKPDNPKSSSAKADSTRSDPAKSDEKISARQSTLIILDRGYIVLFTFISETEEEVDRLIETLSFVSSATKSK